MYSYIQGFSKTIIFLKKYKIRNLNPHLVRELKNSYTVFWCVHKRRLSLDRRRCLGKSPSKNFFLASTSLSFGAAWRGRGLRTAILLWYSLYFFFPSFLGQWCVPIAKMGKINLCSSNSRNLNFSYIRISYKNLCSN